MISRSALPAGVMTIYNRPTVPLLQVVAPNCVHCRTRAKQTPGALVLDHLAIEGTQSPSSVSDCN